MEMVTCKLNLMKLKKENVNVYTNSKVTKIEDGTVYLLKPNYVIGEANKVGDAVSAIKVHTLLQKNYKKKK